MARTPRKMLIGFSTRQDITNALPALRLKVHEYLAVRTPHAQEAGWGKGTARMLERRGIRCSSLALDPVEVDSVSVLLAALQDRCLHLDAQVYWNLGGGQKIHQLAFWLMVQRRWKLGRPDRVVYADNRTGAILEFWLEESSRGEQVYHDRIRGPMAPLPVRDILACYEDGAFVVEGEEDGPIESGWSLRDALYGHPGFSLETVLLRCALEALDAGRRPAAARSNRERAEWIRMAFLDALGRSERHLDPAEREEVYRLAGHVAPSRPLSRKRASKILKVVNANDSPLRQRAGALLTHLTATGATTYSGTTYAPALLVRPEGTDDDEAYPGHGHPQTETNEELFRRLVQAEVSEALWELDPEGQFFGEPLFDATVRHPARRVPVHYEVLLPTRLGTLLAFAVVPEHREAQSARRTKALDAFAWWLHRQSGDYGKFLVALPEYVLPVPGNFGQFVASARETATFLVVPRQPETNRVDLLLPGIPEPLQFSSIRAFLRNEIANAERSGNP